MGEFKSPDCRCFHSCFFWLWHAGASGGSGGGDCGLLLPVVMVAFGFVALVGRVATMRRYATLCTCLHHQHWHHQLHQHQHLVQPHTRHHYHDQRQPHHHGKRHHNRRAFTADILDACACQHSIKLGLPS